MTRIRALVFDLDGTLIDSYPAITTSVNHAREAFGMPGLEEAEVRRRVGKGLERLMSEVVGDDRVAEGVRLFRERYAEVYASGTTLMPDAGKTIPDLVSRGYRLSVASNKPARFSRPILESLGLLSFFRAVHGPDTAGATKPDPSMIALCLKDMEVPASEAAYVGDMGLDVVSADAAGIPVILVPGGSSSTAELGKTGRPVLGGLSELADYLSAGGTSEGPLLARGAR